LLALLAKPFLALQISPVGGEGRMVEMSNISFGVPYLITIWQLIRKFIPARVIP